MQKACSSSERRVCRKATPRSARTRSAAASSTRYNAAATPPFTDMPRQCPDTSAGSGDAPPPSGCCATGDADKACGAPAAGAPAPPGVRVACGLAASPPPGCADTRRLGVGPPACGSSSLSCAGGSGGCGDEASAVLGGTAGSPTSCAMRPSTADTCVRRAAAQPCRSRRPTSYGSTLRSASATLRMPTQASRSSASSRRRRRSLSRRASFVSRSDLRSRSAWLGRLRAARLARGGTTGCGGGGDGTGRSAGLLVAAVAEEEEEEEEQRAPSVVVGSAGVAAAAADGRRCTASLWRDVEALLARGGMCVCVCVCVNVH
eukprot:Rhum_TRINITY_DN14161_c4_g1::Rhum_TRINITY_DN14161_c4_g1_i1::g.70255::m.70255